MFVEDGEINTYKVAEDDAPESLSEESVARKRNGKRGETEFLERLCVGGKSGSDARRVKRTFDMNSGKDVDVGSFVVAGGRETLVESALVGNIPVNGPATDNWSGGS